MSKISVVSYNGIDFHLSTDWILTSKESDMLRALPCVQSVNGQKYEHVITFGACFKKTAHEVLRMCENCLIGEKPKPVQLTPENTVTIRKWFDSRDGVYHPNCLVFCLNKKMDEGFKDHLESFDGVINAQMINSYTFTIRFAECFVNNNGRGSDSHRLCEWMSQNMNAYSKT